jgi:formylglycine-generating enzyme required for sulfatase activity/serine/threonine protein kinase
MTDSGREDPLSLVGTTIADKYAIESVVGYGGFAVVYRATHTLWKRPVAVKVFKALGDVAVEQREKLLEDFIREGALLGELSERSTAICQARDVGTLTSKSGDVVPYMVLEWLDGRPLDAVLERERAERAPLRSLEETVRLLDPIAEALALAHRRNIAHRDVKPANVFVLGDDPRAPVGVKLLDFGIAKVVQDAQKMGFGKTAGHITSFTPLYGAPEQFNRAHGATGPWTDVFALALVAGECVSGREPMSGDDLVQLAYAAADPNKRPTPRALGVAVSDEVDAIFKKAVAVRPEDRFQTAGDFWSALRMAVTGERMSSVASSRALPAAAPVSAGAPANADTLVDPSFPGGSTGGSPAGSPPGAGTIPWRETGPNAGAATAVGAAPAATSASPPATSPPARSKAPVLVGLGAVAALAVAGAVFGLARGGDGTPANQGGAGAVSASAHASAASSAASSAAAAPARSCPAGMIAVPGGEFFMGSDEKNALAVEKPPHRVKLAPYCLDVHEVTVAQYKQCSDKGACRRAGKENVWPGMKPAQKKLYDPLCNIRDPVGKATHPINCVDWEQARELCESRGARLPTEAEWEFAARGPDGRIYPWGDDPPSAKLLNACGAECVAWMKAHPDPDGAAAAMYDESDGFANTAPVGSFPLGKSRYGVEDVVGNVWEWVADWYGPYDPDASKVTTDPKGPAEGTERVIRGGAWNGALPSWVRPSFRYHAAPSSRSYGFGFRCASSVE